MRENWKTNTGFILATIGCAVGLGNIWQFPYVAGMNGGGAFVCLYIPIVIFLGISLIIAEQIVGRHTRQSPIGAYRAISPKFVFNGYLGTLCNVLIFSFYGVVGAWVVYYFVTSLINPSLQTTDSFQSLSHKPLQLLGCQTLFIGATIIFVVRGVNKGIEKANLVMMPLLFLILILLDIRALMLPGSMKGVLFLLKPDFSQLAPETVIAALGQAFFSLSIGLGTILTYASYLPKDSKIVKSSWVIALTDTFVAILAGLAIFPAIFSFGMEPASGPGLLFIALPQVFGQLPAGQFFAILFFTLLLFAALSSSISMLEVPTAFLIDEFHIRRLPSALIAAIIPIVLGILCMLSTTDLLSEMKFFDKSIFDLVVYLNNDIMLPVGGILLCVIIGWVWGVKKAIQEINDGGREKFSYSFAWSIMIRYIAPVAILIILLSGLALI